MIPVLESSFQRGRELAKEVIRQCDYLEEYSEFLGKLFVDQLLSDVEITSDGLICHPGSYGPKQLFDAFTACHQVVFTRTLTPGGLYNWYTTIDEYNFQLFIVANEEINHEGTVVSFQE